MRINALVFFIGLLLQPASEMFCHTRQEIDDHLINNANKIIKKALTEEKGYKLLGELCRMGPRLSGSAAYEVSARWIAMKMKEWGFDVVELQSVIVTHWERGERESALLRETTGQKIKDLSISSLGGSVGTPSLGITARVLEISSFEELKQSGEKARGKIVFFNQPMDKGEPNPLKAYSRLSKYRMDGAAEAAKSGAVAVIVRSLTFHDDNSPRTGVMKYQEGVVRIPAVSIGLKDADFLSQAIRVDPTREIVLETDCQPLPDSQSFNIVGEIRGRERPDDIIIVSGHFDSWDLGEGAQDDGGGCVQAMETLSLIMSLSERPKRTIRCVLFADEEMGSRAAVQYAEHSTRSNESILAAIESDHGVFSPRGFFYKGEKLLVDRIQRWLPLLQPAGIEWIKAGESGMEDISKIKQAKSLFGYHADDCRYTDIHHSPYDIYSTVHPREMEKGSSAMAILAYLISEEGID